MGHIHTTKSGRRDAYSHQQHRAPAPPRPRKVMETRGGHLNGNSPDPRVRKVLRTSPYQADPGYFPVTPVPPSVAAPARSVMTLPVYVPPKSTPVRAGAEDAMKIPSRGVV